MVASLGFLAIVALIVTNLVGPGQGVVDTKKTLVYCSEGGPGNFSPPLAYSGTSITAVFNVHNRLVAFEYGGTKIIPSLAESWASSEDGLTYTFNLRRGVSFHTTDYFTPTREFNADDVIFTINRQRLSEHSYHAVGGGSYVYFDSMNMGDLIADVKKIDDHTVVFTLARPNASFMATLAMNFMSILSKEYADQLTRENRKEDIDHFPVGTGAFIFESYDKDSTVRYRANPSYWEEGLPRIQNLLFSVTPDASVRFQKLKSGECHLAAHPPLADLPAAREDRNLKVMEKTGLNVAFLAMNTEKIPFNNPLVRQAIHHVLNKESYLEAIFLGDSAQMAKSLIPPTMWGYHEGLEDYPHNVEKARTLLAQAGFPDGFETDLWTLPVNRPYNPNGRRMGEMMQTDLARIGIRANLVSYDWATYLARSRQGDHSLLQLGWTTDNGDPDTFLNTLLGCNAVEGGTNTTRWCDNEFNSLVVRAVETDDINERTRLYREAQEIFKREAPLVPLAHATIFRVMRANVENFEISVVGPGDTFKFVGLK